MSLLQVKNISVQYNDYVVLNNCSFSLDKGEILVLLGASGEGKTTLLKSIAGLISPTKGDILFENEKVKSAQQKLIPGHSKIKLINQDFNLDIYHSVRENIKLRLMQYNSEYQITRIEKLLQLIGLKKYENLKAKDLSGGQQQRLAIARALADEPELLLLDEPFNQLDFQTKTKIEKHIRAYLKKEKIAAIFVTHNGIEAMNWADKIAFVKNGKIKRIDSPESFFNQPTNLVEASFFGEINKLKIKDEVVYFRPGFFNLSKSKQFPVKINFDTIDKKNLGWYTEYICKHLNQKFSLYSQNELIGLNQVFISPIKFND